jgi:DNA repair exonuclease SbcCD nuclease subunit
LCARWQRETGEHIDLILQAGDLGAYPALERLDKATRRYAEQDPTELGFLQHFAQYDEEVAALLKQTDCPLVFVRGNHEDHQWLDELEQQANGPIFPVDAYRRVWCLKSGVPYTFRVEDKSINVLGVGRIGLRDQENETSRSSQRSSKHIQPYEQKQLYRVNFEKWQPDVLLTHDSARGFVFPDSGLTEIDDVLASSTPLYHFFGHYGGDCEIKPDVNGQTVACKLGELHWDRRTSGKVLEAGSLGILRWHNREEQRLEIVDEPWLKEYTAFSWEHL